MQISIIITSYNNVHNLTKCIDSVLHQDYNRKKINVEIVIVDAGSTDKSTEILKQYKTSIKVITKPIEFSNISHLSPALVRNIGFQNTKGEILLFTDSDCIVPSNWLKNIVKNFQKNDVQCVIGNREPDEGEGIGAFIRKYDFILYSNKFLIDNVVLINSKTINNDSLFILISGNNFAIKRQTWKEIGGMNTLFKKPTGEDILMEIEIIRRGYSILFDPTIKITHNHPLSFMKLIKRGWHNGESTYLLYKNSNKFISWRTFFE